MIGPLGSIHFPDPEGEQILCLYESKDQDSQPTEQWEWQTDWGANRVGYEEELIHFFRCVREGLKPCPSGKEAMEANVLAAAVEESSLTGQPVYL